MARIETDPNYSTPTFPRATAAADLFKKEDVQALAAAMSTHEHGTGKGLPVTALASTVTVPAGGTTFQGGNVAVSLNLTAATLGVTGAATVSGDLAIEGGFSPPTLIRNTATYLNIYNDGGVSFLNQIGTAAYLEVNNTNVISLVTFVANASLRARSDLFVGLEAGPSVRMLVTGTAGDPVLAVAGKLGVGGNAISMGPGAGDIVFTRISAGMLHVGVTQMGINMTPQGSYVLSLPNAAPGAIGFAWTPYSAAEGKTDIVVMADALELVRNEALHGVRYTHAESGTASLGFIADEWLPLVPEIVVLDEAGQPLAMDYDRVGAITFEGLKQYIAQTDARLTALEAA